MRKKGAAKNETKRAKRIAALKRQAKELAGGKMLVGELEECSPEVTEQFWERVVAYEKAPWTTNFKQLEESGMQLPAPETVDDEQLTHKLWELIQRLALLRVFLDETDHLSDRETLYTALVRHAARGDEGGDAGRRLSLPYESPGRQQRRGHTTVFEILRRRTMASRLAGGISRRDFARPRGPPLRPRPLSSPTGLWFSLPARPRELTGKQKTEVR